MKRRLVITGAGGLIFGAVVTVVFLMVRGGNGGLLSPLGRKIGFINRENKSEVVGFLPTWMIGKTEDYCEELSHLVFLGVEVEETGDLVWDVQSKKINDEKYVKLKNRFEKCGGKNIFGVKLFEDEKIEKLLANKDSRKRLTEQVKAVVEANNFDGVNVDFEYMGDPTAVLEDEFVGMIGELKSAEVGEISVDVFANTIIKGPTEGIKKLMGIADRVIVMAYDFHRSGSQYAGPVAPMAAEIGERSIGEIAERIISLELERKKIILAYPLYGYEWITVDDTLGSKAEDYVQMWSLTRMENSKAEVEKYQNFKESFDEVSLTPWVSWMETVKKSRPISVKVGKKWVKRTEYYYEDETHEVYFENEKSLAAKLELAKTTGVGGVGFWALGYEGKSSWFYNLIKIYGK